MIKPITPEELKKFPKLEDSQIKIINQMLIENRYRDGSSYINYSALSQKLGRCHLPPEHICKFYRLSGWDASYDELSNRIDFKCK